MPDFISPDGPTNRAPSGASPTLGVVVPCFNGERTIARCLDSILSQEVRAHIVVVDDGSTDGSAAVLDRYRSDAEIVTAGRGGACRARNLGLERVDAGFVCFLDADDAFVDGALQKVCGALEAEGQVDMLVSNYFDVIGGEARLSRRASEAAETGWIRAWARQENVIGQAVWYATGFVKALGGWTETVRIFQDYDLSLRAVLAARAIRLLDTPTVFYHHHAGAGRVSARRDAASVRSFFDCFLRIYEQARTRLDQAEARALAEGFLRLARLLHQAGDDRAGRRAYEIYRSYGDPRALDAQDDSVLIKIFGLELRERLGRLKRAVLAHRAESR